MMAEASKIESIEEQVRECFGRVVYTHKTHEKMADQLSAKLNGFKVAQISLASITSGGLIGVVFSNAFWLELVTAGVAVLTAFVSTYMKNYDLGGLAQQHRDTAAKIWPLRESYFSLLTDLARLKYDEIATRRDGLQEALAAIYASAPQTNARAYAAAQKALKHKEELTFSAPEIDSFLPEGLKRGKIDP